MYILPFSKKTALIESTYFSRHEEKEMLDENFIDSYMHKKFPNKKFILFFHNNSLDLKGSQTVTDRKYLYKELDCLVFLSVWMRDQFFKDIKITDSKKIKIFYPGIEVDKKFPVKKNIILY